MDNVIKQKVTTAQSALSKKINELVAAAIETKSVDGIQAVAIMSHSIGVAMFGTGEEPQYVMEVVSLNIQEGYRSAVLFATKTQGQA